MGFVVDKVTHGQVILQLLQVFLVSIIAQYLKIKNPFIILSYQLTVSLTKKGLSSRQKFPCSHLCSQFEQTHKYHKIQFYALTYMQRKIMII